MTPSGRQLPQLQLDLPLAVRACVQRIEEKGAKVWLVGGGVRDALLGRSVEDWDLASTATPLMLAEWFPDHLDLDPRLGRLCLQKKPQEILVTTLREDGAYSDLRHPDQVDFVEDPAEDCLRRDFTVNAIYADLSTGVLTDPTGGVADLLRKPRLRMIGDPLQRLAEDPLRILRALRFSAGYGLPLDSALRSAILKLNHLVGQLSVDRRRMEFSSMIRGEGAGAALRLLLETGLIDVTLPVQTGLDVDAAAQRLDMLDSRLTELVWAALLVDLDPDLCCDLCLKFGLQRTLREQVIAIHAVTRALPDLDRMIPYRCDQILRSAHLEPSLELAKVLSFQSARAVPVLEEVSRMRRTLPAEPMRPWFTGADLIAMGVAKGPLVGAILAEAEFAWERAGARTADEADVIMRQIVCGHIKDASP